METFNCYTEHFNQYAKSYSNNIDALRAYGQLLYNSGYFKQAIFYYNECINAIIKANQKPLAFDYGLLSLAFNVLNDHTEAYQAALRAVNLEPTNFELVSNVGLCASFLNKYEEAIQWLKKCLLIKPNHFPAIDGIALAYACIGNINQAVDYGNLSLSLKDTEACQSENIKWLLHNLGYQSLDYKKNIKQFDPEKSERNIISFSLWGEDLQYTDNAIKNVLLAKVIYPGWTCRFYCDNTVPLTVKNILIENGAQLIESTTRGAYYGTFWRFQVMNDPNVDFFLIRDCDSLLNCQERVAVDEWLASNTCFHLMRDFYSHTELILAGMFGGVANLLPNFSLLIDRYYDNNLKLRIIDQLFLRHCLWPFAKQSYLTHDSHYTFGNTKQYPKLGRFPSPTWNVGKNWYFDKKGIFTNHKDNIALEQKLKFF